MVHVEIITHLGEPKPGLLILAKLSWRPIRSQETNCGTFPFVCVSVPMPYKCRDFRVAGFEDDQCAGRPQQRVLDTFY
jgi:hypothetical protein